MGIYNQRDKPAYGPFKLDDLYSKNPYILKWWTSSLDELIETLISKWQWVWYWGVAEEIVKLTPSDDWHGVERPDLCWTYRVECSK